MPELEQVKPSKETEEKKEEIIDTSKKVDEIKEDKAVKVEIKELDALD